MLDPVLGCQPEMYSDCLECSAFSTLIPTDLLGSVLTPCNSPPPHCEPLISLCIWPWSPALWVKKTSLADAKPSLDCRPFCSHFAVTSRSLSPWTLAVFSLATENVAVFFSVCLKLILLVVEVSPALQESSTTYLQIQATSELGSVTSWMCSVWCNTGSWLRMNTWHIWLWILGLSSYVILSKWHCLKLHIYAYKLPILSGLHEIRCVKKDSAGWMFHSSDLLVIGPSLVSQSLYFSSHLTF